MTSALFPGQNLPPHFDPVTVAAIEGRLLAVEGREKARLLFAIESGSRAWDFPHRTAITIAASSTCGRRPPILRSAPSVTSSSFPSSAIST